eukprot:gene8908-3800_t
MEHQEGFKKQFSSRPATVPELGVIKNKRLDWMKRRNKNLGPTFTESQNKLLKDCFNLMDEDGSGSVELDELDMAFKLLGFPASPAEIKEVFKAADSNNSGGLDWHQFRHAMTNSVNALCAKNIKSTQGLMNHTAEPPDGKQGQANYRTPVKWSESPLPPDGKRGQANYRIAAKRSESTLASTCTLICF